MSLLGRLSKWRRLFCFEFNSKVPESGHLDRHCIRLTISVICVDRETSKLHTWRMFCNAVVSVEVDGNLHAYYRV